MMNTDYIAEHTGHSHHLQDLAAAHNMGLGIHHDPNHLEFNGIAIPDEVIRQLKMLLGENVHTLSSHELNKAAMNFRANGQVIRDDGGVHLHDMMHEHWGENPESDELFPYIGYEHVPHEEEKDTGYASRLGPAETIGNVAELAMAM